MRQEFNASITNMTAQLASYTEQYQRYQHELDDSQNKAFETFRAERTAKDAEQDAALEVFRAEVVSEVGSIKDSVKALADMVRASSSGAGGERSPSPLAPSGSFVGPGGGGHGGSDSYSTLLKRGEILSKRLAKFSGRRTDVVIQDWIMDVEMYAETLGLGQHDQLIADAASTALTGDAAICLRQMPREDRLSWQSIKTRLKDTFFRKGQASEALSRLQRMSTTTYDSWDAFIEQFNADCLRATGLDDTQKNHLLLAAIKAQFPHEHKMFRSKLVSKQDKKFSPAQLINKLTPYCLEDWKETRANAKASSHPSSGSQPPAVVPIGSTPGTGAMDVDMLCAAFVKSMHEIGTRGSPGDDRKKTGRCRYCDKLGHWWMECFKLAKDKKDGTVKPSWKEPPPRRGDQDRHHR
jgi:hypothetical protein